MSAATFRCQECETEYFVLKSHKAPDSEAKCVDCGWRYERRQRDQAAGDDVADVVVTAASLRVVYSLRTSRYSTAFQVHKLADHLGIVDESHTARSDCRQNFPVKRLAATTAASAQLHAASPPKPQCSPRSWMRERARAPRHLRQYEDRGGDDLCRQGSSLQSPLPTDVQPLEETMKKAVPKDGLFLVPTWSQTGPHGMNGVNGPSKTV